MNNEPAKFTTCQHCQQPNLRIHRKERKFCNTACRVAFHRTKKEKAKRSPRLHLAELKKQIAATTHKLERLQSEAVGITLKLSRNEH